MAKAKKAASKKAASKKAVQSEALTLLLAIAGELEAGATVEELIERLQAKASKKKPSKKSKVVEDEDEDEDDEDEDEDLEDLLGDLELPDLRKLAGQVKALTPAKAKKAKAKDIIPAIVAKAEKDKKVMSKALSFCEEALDEE